MRSGRLLVAFAVSVGLLAGCVGMPGPTGGSNQAAKSVIVPVYFATDRGNTGSADPKKMFGGDRGAVTYGVCLVSVPIDRRMGELESPHWWRFEFREDPDRHVILQSLLVEGKDAFFKRVATRLQGVDGKALIFIHGYNVTFEDAARRTGQMSYDLGFDGAPMFYSWPSLGNELFYTQDEQSIEWSQANIKAFLGDVFAKTDARNVYIVAHSMGNRGLTRALAELFAEKPEIRTRLKEIILAAPDIDAEVFVRDIAPKLVAENRGVTLYASSRDEALKGAKIAARYRRAGDSDGGVTLFKGIETVDATAVDTSLIGHSYYGENRNVLADIFYVIQNKRASQRFGLSPIGIGESRYWRFKE